VIAVLPYGLPDRHRAVLAEIPVDAALVFHGAEHAQETLADLTPTDHLIIMASSRALTASQKRLNCRISLLLQEPVAIKSRFYKFSSLFAQNYHRVLTHNTASLLKHANARFAAHGGAFVSFTEGESPLPKENRISLVASAKKTTIGHQLRHRIAAWSRDASPDLHLFGRGYQHLENKREAHDAYRFSICIENSRSSGYFTEKLIDSFLCHCLPVYWGAPDIAHFFDPRGMVSCNSEVDLKHRIQSLSETDYQRRLPYLIENRRRALEYADMYANAVRVLKSENDVDG